MLSYTLSTIVAFLALTSRSANAHDDACLHGNCKGVAAKLNTLFLNEDGTIKDSGLYAHGWDCAMGKTRDQGDIGCYTNPLGDKLGDWTIGGDGLEAEKLGADAKCPQSPGTANMFSSPNASLGEYPIICPTPRGIAQGATSFTFLRRDLSMPLSVVEAFPPSALKIEKAQQIWGPTGIILAPTPLTQSNASKACRNPLPEEGFDFWEDRALAYFRHDAASFGRVTCGAGPGLSLVLNKLKFRNDGEIGINTTGHEEVLEGETFEEAGKRVFEQANRTEILSCPKNIAANVTAGNRIYCPVEIKNVRDYEEQMVNTSLVYQELTGEWDTTSFGTKLTNSMCALDPARFDLFVEAQRYKNYGDFFKNWINASNPAFGAFLQGSSGVGNEVLIREWSDTKLRNMAPYMALYYRKSFPSNSTADRTNAQAMVDVSQHVRNVTGISIPVVAVDQANIYLDGDKKKNPFSCAEL